MTQYEFAYAYALGYYHGRTGDDQDVIPDWSQAQQAVYAEGYECGVGAFCNKVVEQSPAD